MTEIIPALVSTIIPVYERPEMIRTAVQSVLDQTYRPIEIIIADDGSKDSTPEVCQELVEAYPEILRYVRHENQGPGPTRELGRQQARGEFIQYLDSDDRLLPNKFTDQVRVLREHEECDIAYGQTRLLKPNGEVVQDPYKWTDREIPTLFPGLLVDRWWCTHTPLYRRTLTDRIGPWCDMRWSQDWEYDARAGALGAKLIHCGSVVSEHIHHDGVRQTGAADWERDPVRLKNRVRLMSVLWERAVEAGIRPGMPECGHFSRWCFAIGRNCAAAGLISEARTLMGLSVAASDSGWDVRLFRMLLGIPGGGQMARLANQCRDLVQGAGRKTMKQSFMRVL